MWSWLKGILFDEAKFRRAVTSLMLGGAMAGSTSAGAAIMAGELTGIDTGQWVRFGVVTLLGALGGAAAVQGNGQKVAVPPTP